MLFLEIIRVALSAVRANKLRSFLTALGIIIGIAAVITMVALGEGAQRSVKERLERMGTNVLTIRPGQNLMGGIDRGAARLTTTDAEAIVAANSRYILHVAPEMERRQQIVWNSRNASLSVLGSWPSYFTVQNHTIEYGNSFTEGDDRGRRRVAVLGASVGERLGAANSAALLGETIQIRGVPFEVIGVLKEKGGEGWMNPDDGIYIPLSTAQHRVIGTEYVRSISVQALDANSFDAAIADIDAVLRRQHKIRPGQPSDFNVRNQASLLTTFEETTKTFTFLLAGIAAISLLVGGIGIMNIMLVSVTERTREIGIRKALGARQRDVLLQFLIEALVLCVVGGVIGLALGVGGAYALQHFQNWNTAVAPTAVILAMGFSVFVGVFFGLWPARRASRLEPILALRYE
jgi:putative ABC transport system permease protein